MKTRIILLLSLVLIIALTTSTFVGCGGSSAQAKAEIDEYVAMCKTINDDLANAPKKATASAPMSVRRALAPELEQKQKEDLWDYINSVRSPADGELVGEDAVRYIIKMFAFYYGLGFPQAIALALSDDGLDSFYGKTLGTDGPETARVDKVGENRYVTQLAALDPNYNNSGTLHYMDIRYASQDDYDLVYYAWYTSPETTWMQYAVIANSNNQYLLLCPSTVFGYHLYPYAIYYIDDNGCGLIENEDYFNQAMSYLQANIDAVDLPAMTTLKSHVDKTTTQDKFYETLRQMEGVNDDVPESERTGEYWFVEDGIITGYTWYGPGNFPETITTPAYAKGIACEMFIIDSTNPDVDGTLIVETTLQITSNINAVYSLTSSGYVAQANPTLQRLDVTDIELVGISPIFEEINGCIYDKNNNNLAFVNADATELIIYSNAVYEYGGFEFNWRQLPQLKNIIVYGTDLPGLDVTLTNKVDITFKLYNNISAGIYCTKAFSDIDLNIGTITIESSGLEYIAPPAEENPDDGKYEGKEEPPSDGELDTRLWLTLDLPSVDKLVFNPNLGNIHVEVYGESIGELQTNDCNFASFKVLTTSSQSFNISGLESAELIVFEPSNVTCGDGVKSFSVRYGDMHDYERLFPEDIDHKGYRDLPYEFTYNENLPRATITLSSTVEHFELDTRLGHLSNFEIIIPMSLWQFEKGEYCLEWFSWTYLNDFLGNGDPEYVLDYSQTEFFAANGFYKLVFEEMTAEDLADQQFEEEKEQLKQRCNFTIVSKEDSEYGEAYISIVNFDSNQTETTIPETLIGYPVFEVTYNANYAQIVTVKLPSTVKKFSWGNGSGKSIEYDGTLEQFIEIYDYSFDDDIFAKKLQTIFSIADSYKFANFTSGKYGNGLTYGIKYNKKSDTTKIVVIVDLLMLQNMNLDSNAEIVIPDQLCGINVSSVSITDKIENVEVTATIKISSAIPDMSMEILASTELNLTLYYGGTYQQFVDTILEGDSERISNYSTYIHLIVFTDGQVRWDNGCEFEPNETA